MEKRIIITDVQTKVGMVKFIEINLKKTKVVLTNYGAGLFDYIYQGHQMLERPETIDDYLTSRAYYGKTIGRTSGRLFPPNFQIDSNIYDIESTDGDVAHLHGGNDGFSFKFFDLVGYEFSGSEVLVTLRYESSDLESGYPGNLGLDVIYALDKKGALTIKYIASSNKDTLCNITNHIYVNLNQNKNDLKDTSFSVNASRYVQIDENYRPKKIVSLDQESFDLRKMTNIEEGIKKLVSHGYMGYDNTYLLDDLEKPAVNLYNDALKLGLEVHTNYPSVVIYTHNYPDNLKLLDSDTDGIHGSVAIECQYEPSGIYHKDLHSAILRKGDVYKRYIKFSPYIKK